MKKHTSTKGYHKTADYIPYDIAMRKGLELLPTKKAVLGFYIIFAVNTGLRAGDILEMKHGALMGLRPGEYLELNEGKTKKNKDIQINEKIVSAYKTFIQNEKVQPVQADQYIFASQKKSHYRIVSLNLLLKPLFEFTGLRHISTHSLRKSFGRHVYEKHGRTEDSLVKLSEIYQHTSIAVTRRYLGLTKEELGSIYMNL